MRKLTFLVTLGLLLGCSAFVWAQQIIVQGVVTDERGNPLPSVSVIVEGTSRGTSTDFDGRYQIQAENNQVLIFSYIGLETQSFVVNSTSLNVILTESVSSLDEVVLIGYGTVLKKDLTGAVDLVTSKDFKKGSVVSAQQLIQGKVAGVSIVSNSGGPGEGANVLIRGIGSLNLESNPLYVVDGIPLDSEGVGGSRNPLNVINPNDIEAISILKDASATAIYGSRAANGVVLISTKKGSSGEFSFSFNARTSVYTPVNYIDVLSASQMQTIINQTQDAELISRLGNANTDWQKEIYSPAMATDNSFSASGSLFNAPFRASLGHTNQDGILKNDNFERLTASISYSPSFFEDNLRINLNARGFQTDNDFADRGAIASAIHFDPTKPIYDPASPYGGYYTWLDSDGTKLSLSPVNPMALLDLKDDESSVERLISNIKIDWSTPVDGLTGTINGGFDRSNSDGFTLVDPNLPDDADGFNGSESDYANEVTNLLFDAYFNYAKDLKNTNINLTAGYSYQSFEYDDSSSNYTEFLNPDGSVNTDTSIRESFIDRSKNVLLSYFGRANINIKDKYLVTATLRADASSKLPEDDRWGQFESIALAWNLHNESFGVDNLFSEFKLRLGFGEIGNVNGLGDYNFLTRYQSSTNAGRYGFGNSFYQTFRPAPINKNLRWEVGKTYNAGLDFRFAEIDLSGSVNAYIKETNDLIATAVVDPFTNFGTTIDANIGDMENKGIELELKGTIIDTGDFSWSFNYNVSYNDNEITRLENEQNVGDLGFGSSLQRHSEGMAPFSYFVYKQIYDEAGKPIEGAYADLNGDGLINLDDRYFYKDPYADVLMGLSTTFNYKNFDLNIVSRASLGNYSYNSNAASAYSNLITNLGRLSNINREYLDSEFIGLSGKNNQSDYFIQNASFFRIDNITLGYTIEHFFGENPLRFYITADNVLVVTNYDGIDPEITGGIDSNFYPRSRVVAFGFNINF